MSPSTRRRALVALVLALAVPSLALAPALASAAPAGAPAAHVAKKRRCVRSRSHGRHCRRAARRRPSSSKVPAPNTLLYSSDHNLRMTVVSQGGKLFVNAQWSLGATCPTGSAHVHLTTRAAITGNTFASTVDSNGVRQRFEGRFLTPHHVVGEGQLSFTDSLGNVCDTGLQRFEVGA